MEVSGKEKAINFLVIQLIVFLIAKLFYGNYIVGIVLIPITIIVYKQRKENIISKKINHAETEFKDMLVSVSDGLKTGYSVENALKESYKDIRKIYGEDCVICRELEIVLSQIKLNIPTERAIHEFSKRLKLKNAMLFSQIFSVAKRTGGNMPEIIKNVTDDIVMKENVREEINTTIVEKRLEQRVMTVIPAFIIVYVSLSSPDFLKIMYQSIMGNVIMTICLVLYITAYIWGEKIVENIVKS